MLASCNQRWTPSCPALSPLASVTLSCPNSWAFPNAQRWLFQHTCSSVLWPLLPQRSSLPLSLSSSLPLRIREDNLLQPRTSFAPSTVSASNILHWPHHVELSCSPICCYCFSHWVAANSFAIPWTVARQAPLSIGFPQARILEWTAISFSRGSS